MKHRVLLSQTDRETEREHSKAIFREYLSGGSVRTKVANPTQRMGRFSTEHKTKVINIKTANTRSLNTTLFYR